MIMANFKTVFEKSMRNILKMIQREMAHRPDTAMQVLVLIVSTLILCLVNRAFAFATRPTIEEVDMYKDSQIKLYDALRHHVLPDLDYDSNLQQRFILQVPGKLLNSRDFYPGKDYMVYLGDPENYMKKVDIPQHVMERMFYLVDVIPGAHPVTGETTGHSLARLYESILDNLDQVGFDDQSENTKQLYYEALDKLIELVPDPENSSQIPLFDLYTKLKKAYHNEQQKVDKTFREKKTQLETEDYQLWLERNYHILDAQIETAYQRWLLYGQKQLTENYLSHLDVASSENPLEKARLALRLSGSISEDWSHRVYPVSLSPSNWFRHLNTGRYTSPTSEQLQAKLEDIKTKIALLENISARSREKIEGKKIYIAERNSDAKRESLWKIVQELEDVRRRCWFIFDSLCDMWKKEEEVKDALSESSAANFKVEMLKWQFGENSSLKGQIELVLMKLRNESTKLQEQLTNSTGFTLSPLLSEMEGTESLSMEEIQDKWQYFEYSSTEESGVTTDEYVTYASIGNVLPFTPKPSTVPVPHTFASIVKNANVLLKAKLLKVEVNRPWFMESLFHDRDLKLKKKDKLVSPGYMKEADFYNEVTRDGPEGSPYLLYQYPTAFLLAKDIIMTFTGLSDKDIHAALLSSFGTSLKGSYGPISFDSSISESGTYNHNIMQASPTVDGLKVYIPGAQVIGYYCDVIPKFPNTYEFSS